MRCWRQSPRRAWGGNFCSCPDYATSELGTCKHIEFTLARLLRKRAVHLAGEHGTPPPLETAMAKTAANLAAKFVCDEAIQLLGGYGYSREYPVERVYRDIRGLCIGAGTVEVQRNFVGQNLLRGMTPSGDGWVGQPR